MRVGYNIVQGILEDQTEANHHRNYGTTLKDCFQGWRVGVRWSLHKISNNLNIMSDDINIEKLKAEIKNDSKKKIILTTIFVTGFVGFLTMLKFSPHLTDEERSKLFRLPRNPDHLRELNEVIQGYANNNLGFVLFAFCYLYIFMQSFAIPGPVFLSILSGQLFGPIPGFILVCLCATFGASACYGLSFSLARGLILNRFPGAIVKLNRKIKDNSDNLFFYMLFLRFTPLIPNISINVAGPIVGLPFKYFFFGTLFGLMPGNIIHIRTGMALQQLNELGTSLSAIFTLLGLSVLALLPTLFKKKLAEYEENRKKKQK